MDNDTTLIALEESVGNQAPDYDQTEWEENGLKFRQVIEQTYANAKISAGTVESDIPMEVLPFRVYLRLQQKNEPSLIIAMRPDEFASIALCVSRTLQELLVAHKLVKE